MKLCHSHSKRNESCLSRPFLLLTTRCRHTFIDDPPTRSLPVPGRDHTNRQPAPHAREKKPKQTTDARWTSPKSKWVRTTEVRKRRIRSRRRRARVRREMEKAAELRRRRRRWSRGKLPFPPPSVCPKSRISSEDTSCSWSSSRRKER